MRPSLAISLVVWVLLTPGAPARAAAPRPAVLDIHCQQTLDGQTFGSDVQVKVVPGKTAQYRVIGIYDLNLTVKAVPAAGGSLQLTHQVEAPKGVRYQPGSGATVTLTPGTRPAPFRFRLNRLEVEVQIAQWGWGASPTSGGGDEAGGPCKNCRGTAKCSGCNGLGHVVCGFCHGTEICAPCGGLGCSYCSLSGKWQGVCHVCWGDGYTQKCIMCGGSGECYYCGGSGKI